MSSGKTELGKALAQETLVMLASFRLGGYQPVRVWVGLPFWQGMNGSEKCLIYIWLVF